MCRGELCLVESQSVAVGAYFGVSLWSVVGGVLSKQTPVTVFGDNVPVHIEMSLLPPVDRGTFDTSGLRRLRTRVPNVT